MSICLRGGASTWRVSFVHLDALWCKVRQNGLVKNAAVLVASGVGENGKRSILGVSVSSGEHEVHWRSFFESLVARGLRGVRLITSDDHSGLKATGRAVFGGVEWQRCQFHLQQNAQVYVPKEEMKKEIAARIRDNFNVANLNAAQSLLQEAVKEYSTTASKLSAWFEEAMVDRLRVVRRSEALSADEQRFRKIQQRVAAGVPPIYRPLFQCSFGSTSLCALQWWQGISEPNHAGKSP